MCIYYVGKYMGSDPYSNPNKCEYTKKTSMVHTLCCLHNCLIDKHDMDLRRNTILPSTADHQLSVMNRGGDFSNMTDYEGNLTGENTKEEDMLDRGDHFDNTNWNDRKQHQIKLFQKNSMNPREYILYKL